MLDFGKHAFYIWASYGLSAAVLGALVIYTFAATPKPRSKNGPKSEPKDGPK